MRKKLSWPFFTTAVFSILILTTIFASDKKKSLQGIKIENVGFSTPNVVFSKQEFIEKLNNDPQYSHLSASEKVKVITEALRSKESANGIENRLSKSNRKTEKSSESLESKKY